MLMYTSIFWTECETLIRQMLVLDPVKRYTVRQVKQHKWMTADRIDNVVERPPLSPGENGTHTFNQQVLDKMCEMGVADEETIKQVIVPRFANVVLVTQILLLLSLGRKQQQQLK